MASFLRLWASAFRPKSIFRPDKPPESSELAAFLYLAEHCLRFDRPLAPMLQPLLTCKKFSCSGFIIVKGTVHFYLPVPL